MTVNRTSGTNPALTYADAYAKAYADKEPDTLETVAKTASLGMFSLSMGTSSGRTATEKAWDSTSRQYKRTLVADLGEKGIDAALTKLRPSDATLIANGAGPATVPTGNPGYAKNLFDRFNSKLSAWDEASKLQNGRGSHLYSAFGQNRWAGPNGIKANFDAFSPGGLLGIGRSLAGDTVTVGDTTKVLTHGEAVSRNFAGLREVWQNGRLNAPGTGTPITLGNYMKYGVGGNWARGIGKFLSSGQGFLGALVSSLQIGFLGLSAGLTAKKQWEKSTEKDEGFFTKLFKTAFAAVKETSKILLGYELGALAYTLVYASIATPFVGAAVGLAAACTTGVLTGMLWNKVLGSSVDEDEAPPQVAQNQQRPGGTATA
jgi:hypothetical protein